VIQREKRKLRILALAEYKTRRALLGRNTAIFFFFLDRV
jgi:hypothetical protein